MNKKITHLKVFFCYWLAGLITYTRARTGVPVRSIGVLMRTMVALVSVLTVVNLITLNTAFAQTQGYNTVDSSITTGMAVGVATTEGRDAKPMIEKARSSRADQSLGVVVTPDSSLVAVSSGANQVFVASSGVASVYVSNINGTVKRGDLLAPSPIAGVLMTASAGTKGIMGVAVEDFPKISKDLTVKDNNDKEVKTKVGLIKMNMDVKLTSNAEESNKSFLQKISETFVGQPVSTTQVVVAMIILLVLLFVVGGIVYGAISSSIISLGRNPLGRGVIMRGLAQISILVVVVLAVGLAAVYVVLRI